MSEVKGEDEEGKLNAGAETEKRFIATPPNTQHRHVAGSDCEVLCIYWFDTPLYIPGPGAVLARY